MPAPDRSLPLTPAVLHILLALAGGDRHGYAIAHEVEAVTNGGVRMGPGTLYGSLRRMTADGFVVDAPQRRTAGADDRRRYYRLTALGRRVLDVELKRLAAVVAHARRRRLVGTTATA
jgi:DNA-binding PadR family transcriptional regulator